MQVQGSVIHIGAWVRVRVGSASGGHRTDVDDCWSSYDRIEPCCGAAVAAADSIGQYGLRYCGLAHFACMCIAARVYTHRSVNEYYVLLFISSRQGFWYLRGSELCYMRTIVPTPGEYKCRSHTLRTFILTSARCGIASAS